MTWKHSQFFFGHIVDSTNRYIDFDEGGGELTAVLGLGSYTLTDYLIEVSRAMTEAGTQPYAASVDRVTRIVSIEAPDAFDILFDSGSHSLASACDMIGFNNVDYEGFTYYLGIFPSGLTYRPQAPLNEYTPFEHWQGANQASINESASGRTTVISFGEIQRMRCNIRPITDKEFQAESVIKSNINATTEALDFLKYITKKNPVEFMFDSSLPNEFSKCILESTKDSKDGVSFELYEGLTKGLRGVYETKTLVFRRIE